MEIISERSERPSLVHGEFLPSHKFVASHKQKSSALGIDEETRKKLKVAEYYHYLSI